MRRYGAPHRVIVSSLNCHARLKHPLMLGWRIADAAPSPNLQSQMSKNTVDERGETWLSLFAGRKYLSVVRWRAIGYGEISDQ